MWEIDFTIWVFPKIVVPRNGWFTRDNPIRIDDLGVPLFLETPIFSYFSIIAPLQIGIPLHQLGFSAMHLTHGSSDNKSE